MSTDTGQPTTTAAPAGIRWEPSPDDTELTLYVDGARVGGLHSWKDRETGESIGMTAVLASEQGDKDVDGTDFWMSKGEASVALLTALGMSVEAAKIVVLDRTAALPVAPAPEPSRKLVGQEITTDLRRRVELLERGAQPHGCICPPGAEATCRGPMCPRRPIGAAT